MSPFCLVRKGNDTEEAKETKGPGPAIERVAMQSARYKANIAKWGLSIAIFLFAILITIIILVSQGIGINVVAPLAVVGLAVVWVMGWRRWNELYKRFYAEELSTIQEEPSNDTIVVLAKLSPREIEMLNYIAQGYFNKQIAFELGISESTVKSHVTSILSKLDANDRTEAAVIAIRHGLIPVK